MKQKSFKFPPIKLHPENPHYLLFRGKPTVLITSGEHYGAVLNLDFDYIQYLNELKSKGLNLTRTFSGFYHEVVGAFNIKNNTLAPVSADKYICLWNRTDSPGAEDGMNKFDLTDWNQQYFTRLKDFVSQASKRGIVVEFVLFCVFYDDSMWNICPMKYTNNINNVEKIERKDFFSLKNKRLLRYIDNFVRKVVTELNEFDNLYYEIINEPYTSERPTQEWQNHIISQIIKTESKLKYKHLIAQNIANYSARIIKPNRNVSIFNFHYARPPTVVGLNYHLNRVIAYDETGFDGYKDSVYRKQAWDFIIAGGGVFSNLDYSFTSDRENGTAKVDAPGGGSPELRKQMKILKKFIHSFNFIKMKPDEPVINFYLPLGTTARALVDEGKQYAVYINGENVKYLLFVLPKGNYIAEWVNTKTGNIVRKEKFKHTGGEKKLELPKYTEDIALRILGK